MIRRRRRADKNEAFERLIALVARERRRRSGVAVHSLWRIGDAVLRLKRAVGRGSLRRALRVCATQAGIHVGSLDAAARAAAAFRKADRRALSKRFEGAGAELTPSQVVELAGASPTSRTLGVEILLRKRLSVRELRSYMQSAILRRSENRR